LDGRNPLRDLFAVVVHKKTEGVHSTTGRQLLPSFGLSSSNRITFWEFSGLKGGANHEKSLHSEHISKLSHDCDRNFIGKRLKITA
jgi:hypothetical protein